MVTIYILLIFTIFFFCVSIPIYFHGKRKKDKASQIIVSPESNNVPFSKKDWLAMSGITLLSAIMIFFQIGSFQVPQSSMELYVNDKCGNEIILDFGKEVHLTEMDIFLGHMDARKLAISYYDEATEEWIVLSEDSEVVSVYDWNEISIDHDLRYLGVVSRDYEASYIEFVFFNEEHDKVLPVNANQYAALFDEQDLYPESKTYYYRTMFDEVYYSRSAYEFINGYNIYEVTHPPLGKILMGIGVAIFGITPFGWRFVCALLGVLMVPTMYMFVRKMTSKTKYAAFGTAVLTLDCMHLTLSRIATIDNIVAFFVLLMFTLMFYLLCEINDAIIYKKFHITKRITAFILSGAISTGCAVATKWTGCYAAAGIALLFLGFVIIQFIRNSMLKSGRRFLISITIMTGVLFLGITALIYLLSYVPMSHSTGISLFQTMINNGKFMLSFHSDIVFDHPYSSPWYMWPLDLTPLMDANNVLRNQRNISAVATLGNPVIWWGGLLSLVYQLYQAIFKRKKSAIYICIAYLTMLVPWFFIRRTVFIYQYYICSILLCVILALTFMEIEERLMKKKNLCAIFLECALIGMIVLYPISTGIPGNVLINDNLLRWIAHWHQI